MRLRGCRTVVALLAAFAMVPAQALTLDFAGAVGSLLDGQASGFTFAVGDVVVVATHSGGQFNRTSSGFGINAVGSGDDTDGIDAGSGVVEWLALTFDTDVALQILTVTGLGNNDRIALYIGDLPMRGLVPVDFAGGVFDAWPGGVLRAGDALRFQHGAGNGFSLEQLTLEVLEQVPAGATAPLVVAGLGALTLLRVRSPSGYPFQGHRRRR